MKLRIPQRLHEILHDTVFPRELMTFVFTGNDQENLTPVKLAGQMDTFVWLSHFWDIFSIFVEGAERQSPRI